MHLPRYMILFFIAVFMGCQLEQERLKEEPSFMENQTKSSSIYELNIRQHTAEGTFEAALGELEGIRKLGCDILWIMPVHPIGEKNRKGKLGSYYSIRDYKAINQEMGSKEDFQMFVDSAHQLGFLVILDWVANHTSWDHAWTENHLDFYTEDENGNRPIVPKDTDWTDVADLDYSNEELRDSMMEAMAYWVREFDIDGYRCDVAGHVPLDFWVSSRKVLDEIKPVFMLAEWDEPEMHKAFHMTYAWSTHGILSSLKDTSDPSSFFFEHLSKEKERYDDSAYRMQFITNHDENSWKKSVFDRYENAVGPLLVLTYTIPGMPLVYSGQEVGMRKTLRFFDKDTVQSGPDEAYWRELITDLLHLKKDQAALWNGRFGGGIEQLSSPDKVIAFRRFQNDNHIDVAINLSDSLRRFEWLPGDSFLTSRGTYFSDGQLVLPPFGFWVGSPYK